MLETPKISEERPKLPEDIKNPVISNSKERTKILKKGESEFEKLEKNKEYNENLRQLMSSLSWYIDAKLGDGFNKIQKDNIKLVFLDKFLQDINSGGLNNISSKIQKTLNNIASIFSKKEKNKGEDEVINIKNFKNEFSDLGFDSYINNLDKELEKLKEKKDKKQFNKLSNAFSVLGLEEKDLSEIKKDLAKTSKVFDGFGETASIIQKGADKLGMGDMLKDFISSLKDIPIIGPFLMMFFKGFEKNNGINKKQKSILNLQKLLKNKDKSPLDKIEENKIFENKEKLNSEKLKDFYKYLDSKNIDYSDKNFWENFLIGKNSNGDDIPDNVSDLKKIFDESFKNGDSMQEISLEDFIKKLNNLGKIEDKKIIQKTNEEIKKLEGELNKNTKKYNSDMKKTEENNQAENSTDNSKNNNSTKVVATTTIVGKSIGKKQSSEKIEKNNLTEEEKQRKLQELYNLKFEKSLLTVGETHKIYFKFKGKEAKEMSIELNGKILELDGIKYNIELLATEHDNMQILKNISFSGNNVVLEYQSGLFSSEKKVLSPTKFGEILKSFGENNGSYSQKIPGKPAILKITKA